MKIISKYQCEICKTTYDTQEDALLCEKARVLPCPFEVGKTYLHHEYGRKAKLRYIAHITAPDILNEKTIDEVGHGYILSFDNQIHDCDHISEDDIYAYGIGYHHYTDYSNGELPDYWEKLD